MTALPHDIELVVFDILGTMVDEPSGIRRGIEAAVPGIDEPRAGELLLLWQGHVEEQQRAMLSGSRAYADSTVVDVEAATRVAAEAGIEDDDTIRALARAAQELDPWLDSVEGLARIAEGHPVVGLSNASPSALTRISAHAGLRWHQVLSATEVRTYKPHPDVYRLAIANAGCNPERLLMVAAHAWDLRGAQAAGMRTAYVERPVGDPPSAADSFDLYAESLDDLAARL